MFACNKTCFRDGLGETISFTKTKLPSRGSNLDVWFVTANFGVIGLTDESKSILLGMHNLGYIGCVYDFTHDNVKAFLENEAKDTKIIGASSLEEMIISLKRNRCIVMFLEDVMIQDFIGIGLTIDDFIDLELLPHMSFQDYFIDASSSGREDSPERVKDLMEKGIRYVGLKEGASVALLQGICICLENERFWGPIINKAVITLGENAQKVASKSEEKFCCHWGVPGHKKLYIEYTVNKIWKHEMRYHREAYGLLSKIVDLKEKQKSAVLHEWSKGDLNSLWCWSGKYNKSNLSELSEDQKTFVGHLEKALLASQIIEYAQGYASIRELAELHQWDIDYAKLKLSLPQHYHYKCAFYRKIRAAFTKNPQLRNLLLDEEFAKVVNEGLPSIKEVIARATELLDKVEKLNDIIVGLSVEGFKEILGYYQDFTADKPLCARLFDRKLENEEPIEELDLSPLYKYQYQLRGLQTVIEKIEKTINQLNEESEDDERNNKWCPRFKSSAVGHYATQKNLKALHGEPKLVHRACMKHLEKDERLIPLHTNILSKRIEHVKKISKAYLWQWSENVIFGNTQVEYDYDYEVELGW